MNFNLRRITCELARSATVGLIVAFTAAPAMAQILFQDGFESGDLSTVQNGIYWGARTNTTVSSTTARSSGYALQFLFRGVAAGQDSFSEQRIEMGGQYTDLWFMFDLYVPSNYYHRSDGASNNKFFAVYRNPYTAPGFQVNFSTQPNGSGGSHLEIHSYNNGSEGPIQAPASGRNFITSADAGRWHKIILHVRVPTGQGTNDGVMQLWKNGVRMINITNLASWGGSGANYFDAAYVLGWANSGFNQDTYMYIDNMVISDTPLGIDGLPPGHWYEAPNSKMQSVFPAVKPLGTKDASAILDAWGGGVFDTKRDRLVLYGGGHNDYAGNELYAFDVPTESWIRLTDPTPNALISPCVDYYGDGRPSATHTYNRLQYLPNIDGLVSVGMSPFSGTTSGCSAYRHTDVFNFTTGAWERHPDHPELGHTTGRVTAYDPATGHLWVHGTYSPSGLAEYDPINRSWTLHRTGSFLEIYGTAAIDPNRRLMVLVGGYDGQRQIRVWDLNNPSQAPTIPATTGDTDLEYSNSPGFVYDPVSDRFVGWKGGADVFLLNPANWQWTKVSPAATNTTVPTAQNGTGTNGRFRYIPSKNAFLVVNRANENVYFFRLTSGSGSQVPTLSFAASPTSVTSGSSSTLTWTGTGVDSCTASGAWSGVKAISGTQSVSPTSTSTYSLSCTGAGGTTTRSVTVTVTASSPAPTVSLSASPASITSGSSSTLTWSSANATSCTASGSSAFTGTKATSGSQSVSPTSTTTYTLNCTGSSGSASGSVTVTVSATAGGGSSGGPGSGSSPSAGGGGGSFGWLSLLLLALVRATSRRAHPPVALQKMQIAGALERPNPARTSQSARPPVPPADPPLLQ